MRRSLSRDTRLLVAGQAVRGLGYGFTAVVLGSLLAAKGVSPVRAGVLLATLIGGSALSSLAVGAYGDRFGRRRSYGLFFVGVGLAGAIVATNPPLWLLFVVAVTGTLSTDVVDNGAATTLEQVMLATETLARAAVRVVQRGRCGLRGLGGSGCCAGRNDPSKCWRARVAVRGVGTSRVGGSNVRVRTLGGGRGFGSRIDH